MDQAKKEFLRLGLGIDVDALRQGGAGAAAAGDADLGFARQPMGSEYTGEDTSSAWRVRKRDGESDEAHQRRIAERDATNPVRTEYFSDEQRADYTMRANARGELNYVDPRGAAGNADRSVGDTAGRRSEFALDPATGDTVLRHDHLGIQHRAEGDDAEYRVHHSTFLAGRDVALAGDITVDRRHLRP